MVEGVAHTACCELAELLVAAPEQEQLLLNTLVSVPCAHNSFGFSGFKDTFIVSKNGPGRFAVRLFFQCTVFHHRGFTPHWNRVLSKPENCFFQAIAHQPMTMATLDYGFAGHYLAGYGRA